MSRPFLLAFSFWLVLGFVSWNVVFDRRVAVAAVAFTREQTLNHQQGRPLVSIDEGFSPEVRAAAGHATLWAGVIVAIGAVISLTARGHRAAQPATAVPMNQRLIYDWNRVGAAAPPPVVMLDDETLRDGLQSPSVRAPSIDDKIRILHLIDALGIDTADIGLPGAGPHVARDVEALAREIARAGLKVRANCAARTHVNDIAPIVDIVQRTGVPIECGTFIGSSPIRQYTEGWTLEWLLKCTEDAVTFAVREGLDVMYVTEDTTRADPRHAARDLPLRDSRRRQAHLHRRHGRPRDARRRGRGREVRRRGDSRDRRRRRHRLARPSRSRHGRSSTASPRSKPAPPACTAPRSASASASATRRWTCCS